MKLGDFRKHTKDLPDNVTSVDIVDDAAIKDKKADGQEAIDLEGGKQQTIVLRY